MKVTDEEIRDRPLHITLETYEERRRLNRILKFYFNENYNNDNGITDVEQRKNALFAHAIAEAITNLEMER